MPLDTSETQNLVDALVSFSNATHVAAEAILEKGALEAKKNLQAEAQKSKSFKRIAPAISYDKKRSVHGTEIELGPDKEKVVKTSPRAAARAHATAAGTSGNLANLAYFGGANGGGGTLDFDEPVEREFDAIDTYMKKLGDAL